MSESPTGPLGGSSPGPKKRTRLGPAEAARLLSDDWEGRSYLALDVETTGLDLRRCRIVEIGAILFTPREGGFGGRSIDRLVDPGMPMPREVIAIHGITDEDVRGAPSFGQIADDFLALTEGAILVAHNAAFDLGFIQSELAASGRPPLANLVLDSLVLARAAFKGLPSYSLPRLAASLHIATRRSHRALDDAIVAAKVFVEAGRRLRPEA
ncbi:MAG TPA: 3'-5' exonuclease [Rectinemataceae bacterium]|nr:3'-5' exonuclease [Rectinemataceae bacterium]